MSFYCDEKMKSVNSQHRSVAHCHCRYLVVYICMCCSDCFQDVAAGACLGRWGELVCLCCSEEQPTEVKLAAAKVLVSCTRSVLSSPQLPLGECVLSCRQSGC